MPGSTQRHKYIAARNPTPLTPLSSVGPRRWAYHRPISRFSTLGMILRRVLLLALAIALAAILMIFAYKVWIDIQTDNLIYSYTDPNLPSRHVALVFGAGLNVGGGPSPVLYDRVATAADLYKANKVGKLLMTGDNSTATHNEVEAMRRTAIELGVPKEDIVLDYAGLSTWDSCYRAREIFSLSEATLVTQRFHLPRAVYTCNQLGVNSIGVAADRQPYPTSYNEARELPALASTAWNLLTGRQPRFLGEKVDVDNP
jgi:vancomycin permeability regulator SanA